MKKWIYRILLVICLGVFGFSAYQLYLIFSAEQEVVKETEELKVHVESDDNYLEPDWTSLQAESPDIIAWIYLPSCNIDFPVVQGDDNDYYLNHTTKGEYNARGAIFLDSNANSLFEDDNSIVYGHSVEGGGMFTDLNKFSDQAFFEQNKSFYLLTPNGNYECSIMSYAKSNDRSVYYTTSFGDYTENVISQMLSEALYTNQVDTTNKKFITLSTCDLDYGFNSDRRLILTATLSETSEPIKIVE